MVVNVGARKYRVWVCRKGEDHTTGLEVTKYCSGDSSGYLSLTSEPLDSSGRIPASGQLTLVVPPNDLTFDPWENPERWQIGNFVLVQVADQAGTLREPPINRLSIISDPKPPYPGHWILEIELGCALNLYSGVRAPQRPDGAIETRGEALNMLVSKISLELTGTPPGKAVAGYQPDSGSTLVQLAGEFALCGYSAIHQDRSGGLSITRINFKPEQRLFKHIVGRDDAGNFEPLQSENRPPSEVEVTNGLTGNDGGADGGDGGDGGTGGNNGGNRRDPDRQKYSGSLTTTETLSQGAVEEGGGSTEFLAIVRNENWNWAGSTYQAKTEESRARGLIVSEAVYEHLLKQGRNLSYPGPYGRFPALYSEENKQFEGGKEGRLLKHKIRNIKCKGEVLGEWYKKNLLPNRSTPSLLELFEAELIEIEYDYKKFDGDGSGGESKGQVRKITTRRYLPRGQVAASANDWTAQGIGGGYTTADPDFLILAEKTIESWRKRSRDCWEHTIQQYKTGQVRSGTIKAFCQLVKVKGERQVSRNGQIRPPAAERRPASEDKRKPPIIRRIAGKVKFASSERPRTVTLKDIEDEKSAQKVAELLGKLDHFRHRGFRITTAFRDEWFSWKPLSRVDLGYRGFTYWGMTDAVTLMFAQNQAVVVADCMRLGRQPDADTYPYEPLPALQPSDPTPEPFPEPPITELYPELRNTQPLIPTVEAIYPIIASGRARGNFTFFRFSGEQPISQFIASGRSRISVVEVFVASGRARGNFALLPLFVARERGRGRFEEVGEPGLVAYWPLENGEPWEDRQGNHDFNQNGAINLAYDAEDDAFYPEFGYYPNIIESGGVYTDNGSTSGYLERDGSDLTVKTESGRWSYRIKFELMLTTREQLSDGITGGTQPYSKWSGNLLGVEDQWEVGLGDYSNGRNIAWGSWNEGGGAIGTVTPEQWSTVELEYNAVTSTYTIRINGILTVGDSEAGGVEETPGSFFVGPSFDTVENFRIRKLKFYRFRFVPNPGTIESFTARGRSRGQFELIVDTGPVEEPGLLAYWALQGEPWEDQAGDHDLTQNGTVNLVYDESKARSVAEFGYYPNIIYEEDPDYGNYYVDRGTFSGYLSYSGTNAEFDVMPNNGRWSWKVKFDLLVTPRQYLVDNQTGEVGTYPYYNLAGKIFEIYDQIEIYTNNVDELDADGNPTYYYTGQVTVNFNCYNVSGDSPRAYSPTVLNPDTWYSVECEFNAQTLERTIRVNNIATVTPNNIAPFENGTTWHTPRQFAPTLTMPTTAPQNFRISNLKFYKIAFVSRP